MEPILNWHDASVMVTGGTGSFGNKFVEIMLQKYDPKRLVIFSRDELKQSEMSERFDDHPKLRFFIGDVRDRERLERAMHGVDVVIHAAALKQIPSCEYNPFEAIQTNINGTKNVIDAAIDSGVKQVITISTDKAVNPINLYGATKLCAEKLVVQANVYGHPRGTVCAVVRYGNVIGSRGSVIPLFRAQRKSGKVTVTDRGMTRFWIRLEEGVEFAIRCAGIAQGGEIFVPKIPSMRMMDLAETIAPGCQIEIIGIRPGEKLHEILISEDESRQAVEYDDMFVLEPLYPSWSFSRREGWKALEAGFRYSSDKNQAWFSPREMLEMADG
jgi:UDP-N-acetylglucosamine 4,6-dehydratase